MEEGFAKIDDSTPTVFFFDDFLGRIELNRQSLLQRDSALATFVNRVRKSKNARFILTTRAHIFEEARSISDYVDDDKLQLSKYILDVGAYTRKIKSMILFNHLSSSNLTQEHFAALLDGEWLKKIVDHRNYNPRVIASVSSDCLDIVTPPNYPSYICGALENPNLIWSKPFSALDMRCQNLLISLFFENDFGQYIDELKLNYTNLHRIVCDAHFQPSKPDDFDRALRILETGFIKIRSKKVNFVNPSLRDFLKAYLIDKVFLELLPQAARRADWAENLWNHVKTTFKIHPEIPTRFALAFLKFTDLINTQPTLKETNGHDYSGYSQDDLSLSGRISLLIDWWEHSKEEAFLESALDIARSKSLRLVTWRDGRELPEIHWRVSNFVDNEFPQKEALLQALKERLIEVLQSSVTIDELIPIVSNAEEFMADSMPEDLQKVLDSTIDYEFQDTQDAISHLDSEQSLSEHIEYLNELAELTGRDASAANEIVNKRLIRFDAPQWSEDRPIFGSRHRSSHEDFNDDALRSLFSNLINPHA